MLSRAIAKCQNGFLYLLLFLLYFTTLRGAHAASYVNGLNGRLIASYSFSLSLSVCVCILRLIATEIAPRTADAVEAEYGDDYATASDDEEEVEKRAKERRKQRANSKWQKANGKAAGLPEYRRSECGCCGD